MAVLSAVSMVSPGLEPVPLQTLQMGIYMEDEVEPGQPGKGPEW